MRISTLAFRGLVPALLALTLLPALPWQASAAPATLSTRDIPLKLIERDLAISDSVTRLDQLARGRPVVLLTWAPWAMPSLRKLLWVRRMMEHHRGRALLVVGIVSAEEDRDIAKTIARARADGGKDAVLASLDPQAVSWPEGQQSVPVLYGFSGAGEQMAVHVGFRTPEVAPLIDHLIDAAVRGQPRPDLKDPEPGQPALGMSHASECADALLQAARKQRVNSREMRDALSQAYFGNKMPDLFEGEGLPPLSPRADPRTVQAILERFELVDASDWDLTVADPQKGRFVRNMDVRVGDIRLDVVSSGFFLLQVTYARWLDPMIQVRPFQFGSSDTFNVGEISIAEYLLDMGPGAPRVSLLLRPKPGASCMMPDAYWKN